MINALTLTLASLLAGTPPPDFLPMRDHVIQASSQVKSLAEARDLLRAYDKKLSDWELKKQGNLKEDEEFTFYTVIEEHIMIRELDTPTLDESNCRERLGSVHVQSTTSGSHEWQAEFGWIERMLDNVCSN